MKITILILLLILNAIFPDVMLLFPIFVGYCFPNHFNSGYKKLLNFLANTFIVYLLVLLPFFIAEITSNFQELVKIMEWFKKIYLFDLFFFSIIPIGILLIFKYSYKIKISIKDVIINIIGVLAASFLSETLGDLLLSYSDFKPFIMNLLLLFIFHSLYCIWKVNQHEKKKSLEII